MEACQNIEISSFSYLLCIWESVFCNSNSPEIMQFQITMAMNCRVLHEHKLYNRSRMSGQTFVSSEEWLSLE
jgi:hypothetical protein